MNINGKEFLPIELRITKLQQLMLENEADEFNSYELEKEQFDELLDDFTIKTKLEFDCNCDFLPLIFQYRGRELASLSAYWCLLNLRVIDQDLKIYLFNWKTEESKIVEIPLDAVINDSYYEVPSIGLICCPIILSFLKSNTDSILEETEREAIEKQLFKKFVEFKTKDIWEGGVYN